MRQALGEAFERLHPKLRAQYDFASGDSRFFDARGVAEYVRRDFRFVPFLWIGAKRRVMFPETGRDIPVRIRNYAYRDAFGREALTWTRDYDMARRPRRFDEVMVCTRERGPVMYAGTHQHVAIDMRMEVGPEGDLLFGSGGQRVFFLGMRLVFPMFFSGKATGREWYDDREDRYEVEVDVSNRMWGTIFAYRAWFRGEVVSCDGLPDDVRPLREERRA